MTLDDKRGKKRKKYTIEENYLEDTWLRPYLDGIIEGMTMGTRAEWKRTGGN